MNWTSDDPCWFELISPDRDCADRSDSFSVSPSKRTAGSASTTLVIGAPTTSPAPTATAKSTTARSQDQLGAATESPSTAPTAPVQDAPRGGGDNLSPGAKAAVGIGVALICLAIAAMSAWTFLRRRKRGQDTEVARTIIDHNQRCGRTPPEIKNSRVSSSLSSGRTDRTDDSLYPMQPVSDGFPGSMGWEDERPLHSMTNHSPISGPHSPTHSNRAGAYWTQERSIEREELAAARLKSKSHTAIPTVISYGPNPVTPTLNPRPNSRVDLTTRSAKGSPESIEALPHVPGVPVMPATVPDYSDYSYSIPPPATAPSPPRKAALPIVVSYGPNRVTPTPLVVSPTVPPDDAVLNRRFQELPVAASPPPVHQHERQFSFEADSPLLGHSYMGPLPPYASTADFEAMEKGAVRKLEEPQATELPPTKDGFYHYTSDIVEHELPGAAPQNEPQLPFRQYRPHNQAPGASSSGNVNGYANNIDEQKFLLSDLLSDVEIARMREQKAAQKAKRLQEEKEARERGEQYDLGETMGASMARMNNIGGSSSSSGSNNFHHGSNNNNNHNTSHR